MLLSKLRWPWQRQIGWAEIGEDFTRYTLFTCRWGTIYLHRLIAPTPHPQCHDHPWAFVAILLAGGYREYHQGTWVQHRPGTILYRPARFAHNVVTDGVSWSIIFTGPRTRQWGFTESCDA